MRPREMRWFSFGLTGLLALALWLAVPGIARAGPYAAGPYKVDVDVRTSLYLIIPHATVQVQLVGTRIRVSAWAPGYLAEQREIPVKTGVSTYAVMIPLRDRPKRFDIFDFQHKPLVSCFVEPDQGGTPTDQYAINLMVPVKTWPHPSPANVYVNQPGYGWPIQNSCEISVRDDFYRVRMLIDRGVLDDPHDELLIYVNTSEIIDPATARRWFAALRRLEATHPAAAADLARALFDGLPDDLAAADAPASLQRLLALKRRFGALHALPDRRP